MVLEMMIPGGGGAAAAAPGELSKYIVDQKWSGVVEFLNNHANAASRWSCREGFFDGIKTADVLPIHEVCSDSSAPINVVEAIIDSYPAGLEKKESAYNRLPLHIACRKNANVDVIKLLMDKYPKAALEADIMGRYPLHYCLANATSTPDDDVIVDLILKKEPNCARGFDKRGWLPLHVACSNGSSTHVVQALVDAYPESIVDTTNKGSTAITCCTSSSKANKDHVLKILNEAQKTYAMNLYIEKMNTSQQKFSEIEWKSKTEKEKESPDNSFNFNSSFNNLFSFQQEVEATDQQRFSIGASTTMASSSSSNRSPRSKECITNLRKNTATVIHDSNAFRNLQEDLRNKRTYSCIGTAEAMKFYIDARAQEVEDEERKHQQVSSSTTSKNHQNNNNKTDSVTDSVASLMSLVWKEKSTTTSPTSNKKLTDMFLPHIVSAFAALESSKEEEEKKEGEEEEETVNFSWPDANNIKRGDGEEATDAASSLASLMRKGARLNLPKKTPEINYAKTA